MKLKKLLIFSFISLLFGTTANAQMKAISECNVKSMTMCGSDLYVGTDEGYYVFDTKAGETKAMNAVGKVTSIAVNAADNVWYTLDKGYSDNCACHFDGKNTTTYSVENGAIKGGQWACVGPKGITIAPDGSVWFGAYGFFHKFDGKAWTNYTCPKSNFGRIYYKTFAFDSNGTIWIGGKDQQKNATFGEFDPVEGAQTPIANDFADDGVNSMFIDSDDNLWIGTDSKGFFKYDGSTFTAYNKDTDPDMKSNITVGLCQAANGRIFYAQGKKMISFNGEYQVEVADIYNEELENDRDGITCLYPYGDIIFIGTSMTGIHCFDSNTGELTQLTEGSVIDAIKSISADKAKTSGAIYDLSGRQTTTSQKGMIYIQNGQKFLGK